MLSRIQSLGSCLVVLARPKMCLARAFEHCIHHGATPMKRLAYGRQSSLENPRVPL